MFRNNTLCCPYSNWSYLGVYFGFCQIGYLSGHLSAYLGLFIGVFPLIVIGSGNPVCTGNNSS